MRKSCRIAAFLMLSTLRTMRKSRRIAAFLMLSTLNNEEVSQNSSVFKVADRQVGRLTDRKNREIDR